MDQQHTGTGTGGQFSQHGVGGSRAVNGRSRLAVPERDVRTGFASIWGQARCYLSEPLESFESWAESEESEE